MRTRSTVTERRRPASGRRRPHRAARAAAVAGPAQPEQRVREAGTSLDLAHYGCACGFQFAAPVTTSVACPHCGTGQDW